MKKIQKPISILLSLIMIISIVTVIPFEASAEDDAQDITYIYRWWDADTNQLQSEERTVSRSDCIRIQDLGSDRLDSDQGERWIVVDADTTINDRLYINDHTVNLILCDDVTLTLGMGITVGVTDNTTGKLNIFGQENDKGKLYCHTPLTDDNTERAIIGGDVIRRNSGDIHIFGGTLDLNSGDTPQHRYFGACIGGGVNGAAREVCIYGGNLKLKAIDGACIGGGKNGQASFLEGEDGIKIYGGTIEAESYGGAAIGNGEDHNGSAGGIAIYGGEIIANGKNGSAGIGGGSKGKNGSIAIYGGKVAASGTGGKYTGAGIGSGEKADQGSPIGILGGIIVGMSQSGAGIGAGACGSAGVIEISNANVTGSSSAWGAGIGGGKEGNGGEITITDSIVTATSSNYGSAEDFLQAFDKATSKLGMKTNDQAYADSTVGAITLLIDLFDTDYSGAGIGGGHQGDGGTITIIGSTVEAKCGNYAAAIGGGENKGFDAVTIDRSNVDAKSSKYGAAIGSGDEAPNGGGTINIVNSSKVKAVGGEDAAGIGTGNECGSPCDAINIIDSTVEAHGGDYAAAIGGGDDVSGGNITIDNSFVYADRDPFYYHEDEHDEQSPLIEHRNTDGAGIGGGESGHGGNIIIRNNSEVEAHGGGYAAGIGGGDHGDGGNITITDSYVRAYGGTDGAGIGGGEDGKGGHVEIYDSNVYAKGSEFGAGIGAGEDASGDYCGIYGSSTVEAVSGGDGNVQSIGHGDCGWYILRYTGGTLSLDGGLKVKAGSSVYTGDARFSAIRSNKHVIINACEHEHIRYQPVNIRYHAYYCDDCGMRVGALEEHFWSYAYVCSACGTTKDGFKLRFVERNNDGEVVTESETLTRGYQMPACENVPDNMEFACWVAENGDTYLPGERYQSAVGTTMTAKYLSLVETTYIDENGREATVMAREIPDAAVSLTSGWYVINDDLVATEAIRIKGDVNLIMADGAALTFQQVTDSAFTGMSSDTVFSLYGQTNQSGFVNIQSAKAEFANFNQYGARFRLIQANNNALEIGQRYCLTRGSIDIPKLTVPQLELGGGFAVIEALEVGEEAVFSWTDYENTRYQFRLTDSEDAVFTVSDGLYFKDQNGIVYSGALTADEIELLRSNYPCTILTPKIPHTYGEPEWVWSDDHRDATAVFRCTDQGCDDTQEIKAKVEAYDGGKKTEYVASCRFLKREYTNAVDVNNSWEIKTYTTGGGKVTADKTKAEYHETVTLTVTPDEGVVLRSLTVKKADGSRVAVNNYQFQMPVGAVTVTAVFDDPEGSGLYEHIRAQEPYVDQNGEYIPGNPEYFVGADGTCYGVKPDGTADEDRILSDEDIILNHFTFELLENNTYRITAFTGTLTGGSADAPVEFVIPKSYQGKAITELGDGTHYMFTYSNPVWIVLNESITKLNNNVFNAVVVTKVTGRNYSSGADSPQTPNLAYIGNRAFAYITSNYKAIELTLDHAGEITFGGNTAFYRMNPTIHLLHATTFKGAALPEDTVYDFIDDHIPGEPRWTWAEDFSSASVVIHCTNALCDHQETADAEISDEFTGDEIVYTATATLFGQTVTDTRSVAAAAVASVTVGDQVTKYRTFDKALENWAEGSTLTLLSNVKTDSVITVNFTGTLDLNGYTLDRGLSAATANGSVITNNGALTITDSSQSKTGTITGGYNTAAGGAVLNNGTLTVEGGIFTGNCAQEGGAIANKSSATLILNSGTVTDNTTHQWGGAGILNQGTMTMNGGEITENHITATGMNGAGIWTNSSLIITGGTITGNTSQTGNGGGIYYTGGTLNLSGSPVITDNTALNGENDLFINGSYTLSIAGELSESAKIGIREKELNTNAFTSGLDGNGSAGNFVSNHTGYVVRLDDNGEAVLRYTPFVGHSLSLSGDIGVNFYLDLTEEEAENATISFAWFDKEIDGASIVLDQGGSGYYRASCQIAAADMSYPITATLTVGDKTYTDTYSAVAYANVILTDKSFKTKYINETSEEKYHQLRTLVKAMLNYGTSAQIYFDRNTDNPANTDLSDDDKVIQNVTADMINKPYNGNAILPAGVTFTKVTLSLKSETTLSLYFKNTGGKDLTFSCVGKTVNVEHEGTEWVARIRGVKAKEIGNDFTLTVSYGTTDGCVTYSPMTYCYNVLSRDTDDENLPDVVKALYWYWTSAKAYFN